MMDHQNNSVKKADFFQKKPANPVQETKATLPPPSHGQRDEKMEGHFAAMREFLAEAGFPALEGELSRLAAANASKKFTVAVVGEFSKGKSTLINRLLRRDVLPVGHLPTTAALTKLSYRETPTLVYRRGDGAAQRLPLSEEGWQTIAAAQSDGKQSGIAFLGLSDPWLQAGNYEIIDTPGANAALSHGTIAADAALGYTDSAILVISADAPVSQTEVSFIQERLLLRSIPRLMVCITKMDRVPPAERKRVYAYITTRVAELNLAEVPVFVASDNLEPITTGAEERVGFAAIRAQLDAWNSAEQHHALRRRSIFGGMESLAKRAASLLEQQLELYGSSEASRKEMIEAKEELLSKAELRWEDLRIAMLERSTKALAVAEKAHQEHRARIIDFLQYELSHANNPREWWEMDYPFRLKNQLNTYAVGVENALKKRYAEDAAWLREAVANTFKQAVDIRLEDDLVGEGALVEHQGRPVDVDDIKKKRMLIRAGVGVGTIMAGALTMAVAGPVISVLGIAFPSFLLGTGLFGVVSNISSERLLNKAVHEQQEILRGAIEKDVSRVLDNVQGEIEARVIGAYDALLKRTHDRQKEWVAAQRKAIWETNRSDTAEQSARCERMLQKAQSLRALYQEERTKQ